MMDDQSIFLGVAAPGVWRTSGKIPSLRAAADRFDVQTFVVDLQAAATKQDVFQAFAENVQFPQWFGHNWDALVDCLTDLSWLPEAAGTAVILKDADVFAARCPEDANMLSVILAETVDFWTSSGQRFYVLTNSQFPRNSALLGFG